LTLVAAVLVALAESVLIYLATGTSLVRVLEVNFSPSLGLRPSWIVLVAGMVLTIFAGFLDKLTSYTKLLRAPRGTTESEALAD